MADRGKRMMSEEELRKEREEENRRQRREENVNRWWESQTDNGSFPSVPPGFSHTQDHANGSYYDSSSQHAQDLGEPSSYKPRARVLPGTYLGIPRDPPVPTDKVGPEDLQNFWDKTRAPTPPDAGPWYRFLNGCIQFRYGALWEQIHQREVDMALYIRRRRAEGVIEVPVGPKPGEVMLYVMEDTGEIVLLEEVNDDDDPMEFLEPFEEEEEEDEETDEEDEEEVEEEIVEFVGEDEEAEDDNDSDDEVQAWSDTSTITEAPSQVSRRRRRQGRGPGRR